jgi:hypothetical protein
MFSKPTPPQRAIFQSSRFSRYISIQDARDVYDTVKKIKKREDRMATYELFGMDGENVEKYLDTVENLTEMWERSEQLEKFLKSKYIRIGPFHIFIHFHI